MPTSASRLDRVRVAGAVLCFALAAQVVGAAASTESLRLTRTSTVFDGWGTSLCWFANAVGRWPEAERSAIADALFSERGLGFTVVRYNIGGGENPEHHHLLAFRQMDGFEAKAGAWDWSADPGQRWMLAAAIQRGANRLEAFSNAPPYWMTSSGCVSGGLDANRDNLDPKAEAAFVEYLVAVVRHFQEAWGVRFQTLDPFNEPYTDYWKLNGRQEGCHFERATQARIVQRLRRALDDAGLKAVAISASDETNYERALGTLESFDAATLAAISQVNAHAYDTKQRVELREATARAGKPLVMSEADGADAAIHDHGSIIAALGLAERVVDDLRDLHPLRWVFWQAVEDEALQAKANKNWGLIHADLQGATHQWSYTKKYYAMAQFSKFIRPGAELLASTDAQTIAVYHPSDHRLVIVVRNASTSPLSARCDVAEFVGTKPAVRGYRTSAGEDLAEFAVDPPSNGNLTIDATPESITTWVLRPGR